MAIDLWMAMRSREATTFTLGSGEKFRYRIVHDHVEVLRRGKVVDVIPAPLWDQAFTQWGEGARDFHHLDPTGVIGSVLADARITSDEERVIQAFCRWLAQEGWRDIEREVAYLDVKATKANEVLYAEAKGRTKDAGTDVDILYGQLLRRMPEETVGHARFAVVVPAEAIRATLRVNRRIRELLRIEIYEVSSNDLVQLVT